MHYTSIDPTWHFLYHRRLFCYITDYVGLSSFNDIMMTKRNMVQSRKDKLYDCWIVRLNYTISTFRYIILTQKWFVCCYAQMEDGSSLSHRLFIYGTLKRGQPNNVHLENNKHGYSRLLGPGVTEIEFPLVIATQWNIPFLLYAPEIGQVSEVCGQVV